MKKRSWYGGWLRVFCADLVLVAGCVSTERIESEKVALENDLLELHQKLISVDSTSFDHAAEIGDLKAQKEMFIIFLKEYQSHIHFLDLL